MTVKVFLLMLWSKGSQSLTYTTFHTFTHTHTHTHIHSHTRIVTVEIVFKFVIANVLAMTPR